VPVPALVNSVAVVLLMTPVIDASVAAVPSLIVKVRVIPVVAVLLRLILPLMVAVPLALASKVIPTPLRVVLEKVRLTDVGIVAAPCICKVVAVLPAKVKVCVPPVLVSVPLLKVRLPIVSAWLFRSNVPPEIVTFAVSAISSVLVPVYLTVPPVIVTPPDPMALTLAVLPRSSSPALTVVKPV